MTLSEKSAYLKGLMDGLNLNKETAEGKMIAGIVDLLHDMTSTISDLEENAIAVSDELDEIEEDLDAIEEFLMEDDEDDDDDDEVEFDGVIYDVTCPVCGVEISFDEETLEEGSIVCPDCGELLEFDLSAGEEEEDD